MIQALKEENPDTPETILEDKRFDLKALQDSLDKKEVLTNKQYEQYKSLKKELDAYDKANTKTEEKLIEVDKPAEQIKKKDTTNIHETINARDNYYHATDLEGFKGILESREIQNPNNPSTPSWKI